MYLMVFEQWPVCFRDVKRPVYMRGDVGFSLGENQTICIW